MGRYAQSKRRGGGASAAAVPPPPVTVLSVVVTGSAGARVFFSAAVSIILAAPDAGFTIDGFSPESATDVFGDPTAVDVVNNTDWSLAAGSLWNLPAQPNWLLTAAALPESGVCV